MCIRDRLSHDSFFEWEFTNPLTKRHYLLRDRLMSWDGRPARLEIAFDVTDRKRESEAFKFLADAGTMVVDCIRVLEGAVSYTPLDVYQRQTLVRPLRGEHERGAL